MEGKLVQSTRGQESEGGRGRSRGTCVVQAELNKLKAASQHLRKGLQCLYLESWRFFPCYVVVVLLLTINSELVRSPSKRPLAAPPVGEEEGCPALLRGLSWAD